MKTSPSSEPATSASGAQPNGELELVHRAKKGELEAFEELVSRYGAKVFRLVQHITGNREDAEDALQEAFLKAYSHLPQFQENSKFYTWLVRIAVNESLMKLRKRKASRTVSLDEEIETADDLIPREIAAWDENPEQKYARQELQEILERTVSSLPPLFRTVFILRDVDRLSTEETAEVLDLSVPAVKSRLLRARLQLREKLTKYFNRGDSRD
ncbi:MAG: sigma-70 family RNA polymerase sigma factor [Acidobacteria bacterium]|nr:sigma-70 family RNA polymerase sigma factor [Acidobacteriota bacterium]